MPIPLCVVAPLQCLTSYLVHLMYYRIEEMMVYYDLMICLVVLVLVAGACQKLGSLIWKKVYQLCWSVNRRMFGL